MSLADLPLDPVAAFQRFKLEIAALPIGVELGESSLRSNAFLLTRERELEVFYAPVGHLNRDARVILLGLTPGWQQMELSFRHARRLIQARHDDRSVLLELKRQAAFAGSMRTNLIAMLDELGLPTFLGLSSLSALFETENFHLVHTTSALLYPVFMHSKNYGGTPPIDRTPLLRSMVETILAAELREIPHALIVPFGKSVEDALAILVRAGELDEGRVLFDFPHPSGANAHRFRQFQEARGRMSQRLAGWFAQASPPPTRSIFDEQLPALIKQIYDIVRSLESLFPGRRFTPDGHMVGSIGEAWAAHLYDLELLPSSARTHDARARDGRLVQVKATQTNRIAIYEDPDQLIVLQLLADGSVTEVFNGPGSIAIALAGPIAKNGQRPIAISKLRRAMRDVPEHHRIAAAHTPKTRIIPAV